MIKATVHALNRWYAQFTLRDQFEHQRAPRVHENAPMYCFALDQVFQSGAQRVLDVGSGSTAWPALLSNCGYHVTATDLKGSYWEGHYDNRHFYVIQDDITKSRLTGTFDAVMFLSALQHVPDYEAAIDAVVKLTAPDGVLILAFPYHESRFVEDIYLAPESMYGRDQPYGCHVFSRVVIDRWCERHALAIRAQEYYQAFEGELWTCGKRITPPRVVGSSERYQFTALSLVRCTSGTGAPSAVSHR